MIAIVTTKMKSANTGYQMMVVLFILAFGFVSVYSYSQRVGINSTGALPNTSALLDIDAAPGNNMGLLIPRVALTATNSNAPIGAAVATSLLVYNTATAGAVPNNVVPGYYYWDGTKWVQLATNTGSGNAWLILGNAGTVDGTNFLGTTDNVPMNFRVNNQKAGRIDEMGPTFLGFQAGNSNTAVNSTGIGWGALYSNTTGLSNTATGLNALRYNTTGTQNTAHGAYALEQNTFGNYNTATGSTALNSNTVGNSNTATGYFTLRGNTDGNYNTANGYTALYSNTTGDYNTATGSGALYSNTSGNYNTAGGWHTLYTNISGHNNVAIGRDALYSNTTGSYNTANGISALYSNTIAEDNTAVGFQALLSNTTGEDNTATGADALNSNQTGDRNTANGVSALISNTFGDQNTATGMNALTFNSTGNNNTANGYRALYSNTIGYSNVAVGVRALHSNTNRSNLVAIGDSALYNNGVGVVAATDATANTAVGSKALYSNTIGEYNLGTGYQALYSNTTGDANIANGWSALYSNISGDANTAIGWSALYSNTTGDFNTATGINALWFNQTGVSNTATGNGALYNTTGSYNTASGNGAMQANTVGTYNSAFGYNTFPAGAGFSNSTALGANAAITASNKVRLGDVTVTVVEGQVAYTFPSDGRFKNNITEEVKGLDFINRLRPVVYNFDTRKFDAFLMQTASDSLREAVMNKKNYNESSSIRQSGFIAQEVEQAAKESGYNFNGVHKPVNENDNYSIAYSLFTVPLVKAMQELASRNAKLEQHVGGQQKMIYNQESAIKMLNVLMEDLRKENKDLKIENAMILNEVKDLKSEYESRIKKLEEVLEGTKARK